MKVKLFALLLLTPSFGSAAIQKLAPAGGQVEFLAVGNPSFIKIHGKGSAATGNVSLDGENVNGSFAFELGTLDTGIATRDEHMKTKYLEVKKFPKAILELKSIKAVAGWTLQKPKLSDADFEGILTLHGQSQPVKGKFSIDDKSSVDVTFKIKLTDYKVSIPSFAGITVADEVEVTVKIDKLGAI